MLSRNGNVVTPAWADLSVPPMGDRDVLVDGEVIALNDRGLPDFRCSSTGCTSGARPTPPGWPRRSRPP